MSTKRILITGSEGRIGKQLMMGLPKRDYEVVGFDLVHEQDATDYHQLMKASLGAFAIVHTAFNLSREHSRTGYQGDPANFQMGRHALQAASNNSDMAHCIIASSVNAARTENDGNWSYRETKRDLERLASQYAQEFPDTKFTSIRYGRVKAEDTPPAAPLRANQSWISAEDNVSLIAAILKSEPNGIHDIVYGVSNRPDQPYSTENPFGWEPQSWFGLEQQG